MVFVKGKVKLIKINAAIRNTTFNYGKGVKNEQVMQQSDEKLQMAQFATSWIATVTSEEKNAPDAVS